MSLRLSGTSLPRHVAVSRPGGRSGRAPASDGTWRGFLWSGLTAIGFFVISHPRELLPNFSQSLTYLAAVVAVVVLVDVRRVRLPALPWTVVAFFALCGASLMWSVSPDDTIRALILYGGVGLFACLVVANTETTVFLRGITWGAVLIAAVTVWAVVVGFEGAGGPIGEAPVRGFHGNRNIVSYSLVLGLAAALSNRPSRRARDLRSAWRLACWVAGIVIVLYVLYLTRSGTGLAAAAVLVLAALLLAFARRTRLFATTLSKVVGMVVSLLVAGVAWTLSPAVFEALGRRTDFSGRVPLWQAIVDVWEQAPVLGYGWGAIWHYSWFLPETVSAPKQEIDLETGYWLSHGHNIVYDLLPQLGIVGVVLLAVIIGCAVGWLFVPLDDHDYLVARWAALGGLALVVNGVSEPMLSIPVGWFVLVAIAACSSRLRRGGALRR